MATQRPQLPPLFPNPYGPPGTQADPRRLIHYATDGVQPPALLYLDVNDRFEIELQVFDVNIITEFSYRILKPDGEILVGQERLPTAATQTTPAFIFKTFSFSTEGFLLSAVLHNFQGGTSGQRGLTRCKLSVVRGAGGAVPQFTQILMQGGIDASADLSWPNGQNEIQCNGQGCFRDITGTTPAAGADISEAIISASRWNVMSFSATLTTSATVATRTVSFILDDGSAILYAAEANTSQAASLVKRYTFAPVGAPLPSVNTPNVVVPAPIGYRTTSGLNLFSRWRTITTNIQVGDQWSAPQYLVEHWWD